MNDIGWWPRLSTAALRVLPQHLLARGMHGLARCRWPFVKGPLIKFVARRYDVDLAEAVDPDPAHYASFNEFFTRPLRPDARPLAAADDAILCPADGAVSQIGDIDNGHLLQAKGIDFKLADLLAGDQALADEFDGGKFATVYLSPRDYHRVHMPITGQLRRMDFVPGDLFSVSDATTRLVPNLFARNERLVCLFDSHPGPVAVILVGAIFVGSMETVWAGEVRSPDGRVFRQDYEPDKVTLTRGAEMGRFNMGSTVILLFPPDRITWSPELRDGSKVRMGQQIGQCTPQPERT